jgi:hypothetical protein
VPPASCAVAAARVKLEIVAPEVTSKDMRQPLFAGQLIGVVVLPKLVTLKNIESVPVGWMPPRVSLELKNSVTGEHTGGPDVALARAGPVLTVPSTPLVDTAIWYNVGMTLVAPVAHTYMCPALPRNHWLSKAPL